MSVLPRVPDGAWPSLMTARTAAGYLDEKSVESFRRKVGDVYPQPIRLKGIGERWRKVDLDRWIEGETEATLAASIVGLI
jgi:hypothetical protein